MRLGFLAGALLIACGGRIDHVEVASPDAQAEASGVPDAPAPCGSPGDGIVRGPGNACEWTQAWSSGGNTYSADCTCPVGSCTCTTKTGATTTTTNVTAPAVCPPCYLCGDYTGATPQTACGF